MSLLSVFGALSLYLNADSDSRCSSAALSPTDHNAHLGPDAILVHVGIDLRIDMLRDLIQQLHSATVLLVVISFGDHSDGQIIPYLLALLTWTLPTSL